MPAGKPQAADNQAIPFNTMTVVCVETCKIACRFHVGRQNNHEVQAMSIKGGCFCGRIRYEITAPLGSGRCCHCSRCRKAFSGSGSAYSEIEPGSFSWVSGEENLSQYETCSGWGLCFCKTCGTTLCGTHEGHVHGVTLGSVDGDPGVEIEMHIFVGSKAPWDHIGGTAPQFAEFPE